MNKRIFDLWLVCYTQEEIAELENISVQPVKDVISDFLEKLPENLKAIAFHLTDFDPRSCQPAMFIYLNCDKVTVGRKEHFLSLKAIR